MTSRSAIPLNPPLPPGIHLAIDSTVQGPLAAEDISRLAAQGRIGPATLAWHPALDQWTELGRLPELAWLIEMAATPAPGLAGFAPRLAAGAIDTALSLLIVIVPASLLGYWPALAGIEENPGFDLWFNILGSFVVAVYFIVPMSWIGGGATPGYRLLRLRLVEDGVFQPPGLLRTLVWYIVTFGIIVGFLTYFVDPKRRMLHNLVSNTLVIHLLSGKK